jgi:transcriptional regulator of heat shock response
LFSQGLKNLFTEPESADPVFVRRVVEFVEQPSLSELGHDLLISLDDTLAQVVAQLQLGSSQGTLVLLGPARMRYKESLVIAHGITQTVMQHVEIELN